MVSPNHVDEQKPDDKQAPSPAKEKQAPIVVENTRPWLKPLKPTLGTVLPLVGGFALIWCFISYDLGALGLLGLLAVAILGGVCVVLLFPFRWAIGVVSLAFAFGELLAFFVGVSSHSTWEGYSVVATYSVFVPIGLVIGFIAALVGAFLGLLYNKSVNYPEN